MIINIFEPFQIVRTTNTDGTVVHSWVVKEDGTLTSCDVGLLKTSTAEDDDTRAEEKELS